MTESESPRCPKCRQKDRLTLEMNEAGTHAVALCRRCGAQVSLEKQAGKWTVVMQGVAAGGTFLPILNFFGVDSCPDIADWAQDSL